MVREPRSIRNLASHPARGAQRHMPPSVNHGVLFLDADLRVLAADQTFYSRFRVTPKETEGRPVRDLGNGQWNSPALHELLEGVLSRNAPFTGHAVKHDFPRGVGIRHMLVHGNKMSDLHDPAIRMLMGFEDTTAHDSAEEVLRQTEVRYRRLFQTAKDGILILDAHNGHIIDANAFMEGLVGLDAGQLFGKQLYEIGLFSDIDQNKAAFRVLQSNRYIRYDHLPVQNQRGEIVEVEFIANVYNEGPRLVAQCNVRDISQRVRLERIVTQQAEVLADEARGKDEFLAMLSHELRNPLAPIRSAVHLMKLQRLADMDPIQRQAVDIIDRQVGNLTKLVNDLLEVSRLINGRVHLNMQIVDVQEVVQHAIQTVKPLIEQQGHALKLRTRPEPMWAVADSMRLEEVFVNLLNNAAKYTPEGGVITVACEERDGHVLIEISDTGVGLEEVLIPRIFDLFTQAHRSLDRAQGGLGIGLSLAHRLVVLQGGTIQAESAGSGKGSTFTVRLPLSLAPGVVVEALPPAADDQGGERVLVVDDNVDLVTMLVGTLRHKGYIVQSAHTGPDGLTIAEKWLPQIVLLDIGLPGINGYEVARRLRASPTTAHARLIALTGYGKESDIALTNEAGFDAHLTKPYEFDELEKLMRMKAGDE